MFEKRQVRVAAGILYGGTYGVLLGGLYFSRYWANRQITDYELIRIEVLHLMVGMVSGTVFGLIFGYSPRTVSSWLGSLGFGVLGVFVTWPLSAAVLGTEGVLHEWTAVGLLELFPYAGIYGGPILERLLKASLKE
jgi:hypothetical protein